MIAGIEIAGVRSGIRRRPRRQVAGIRRILLDSPGMDAPRRPDRDPITIPTRP